MLRVKERKTAREVAKSLGIDAAYLGDDMFFISFQWNRTIKDMFETAACFMSNCKCKSVQFFVCEIEVHFHSDQDVVDALEDWYLKLLSHEVAPSAVKFDYNGQPFLKYLRERGN